MVKKAVIFLFLVFATSMAFAQPGKDRVVTLHGKKYYQHVVTKGETVYGISRDYKMAAKDIVLENPKAIDGISPGDTINVPFAVPGPIPPNNAQNAQTEKSDSSKFIFHKVESKETVYSLTKIYGVSANTLDSLNPELKDKGLKTGMMLRIPNKSAPPNVTKQNIVVNKDTGKGVQAFKNLVNNGNSTPVQGRMLGRYNVALILTFSPQEVDSVKMTKMLEGAQQFPLSAQISTDFYAGVKVAIDSLAKQGFKVDLHVYNVPVDSANAKLDSLFKSPTLASTNLIIGPLYPAVFHRVAKYALMHQIPIVSPLSPENSMLKDNAFVSKAVPSATTETEQTADYIALHYKDANIIIVHNPDAANDNYYDLFKKRLNATMSIANPKADSVSVARYTDDLNDVGHKIVENKFNIIVVPYSGNSFVPKMVNQISNWKYLERDSVCVLGMHNWASMDVLDPNNLDTIHLHYPSNEYIDYSNKAVVTFITKYRAAYSTEPSYFAYQGFDLGYYYLGLLKKYGTAIQDNLMNEKYTGVHTSFDFYKPDSTGGLENKAIYMLEYRNFILVKDN